LSLDQSHASVDPANENISDIITKIEKKIKNKNGGKTLKIRETTRLELIHRCDIFQSGNFAGDRGYGFAFGANQQSDAVGQGTKFVFVTDDKIGVG
jgi:hypothetical protein